MSKLSCPHCGEIALTKFQKLSLGPARTKTCPHCGKDFKVALFESFIILIVTILPFVFVEIFNLQTHSLKVLFIALIPGYFMCLNWLPLVCKSNKSTK